MFAKTTLFALATFAAASAFAQTVPASTCERPELPSADKPLTDAAANKVNTASKAYVDCAAAYHAARKAAVDESNAVIARAQANAQANVEAANKMQQEQKTFLADLNANVEAREKANKAKAAAGK